MDTWRAATVPLLRRAGAAGLEVTLVRRGVHPGGGGEVQLLVPAMRGLPAPLRWTEAGLVKRVRGVAFTERVSPQASNRVVDAARQLLNALLPDVYVFTDHRAGKAAGASPGYGLQLVAESTTGCALSADACGAQQPAGQAGQALEADTPEELGRRVTCALLQEVQAGGCVDGSHQPMALFLAAVGPDALSTVRLGRLTPQAVRLLREIKEFTGITFNLQADGRDGTVLASCVGMGLSNTARAVT